MKFKAEKNIENGSGLWKVIIEGDEWKKAISKGKTKAASKIIIPGFRKGKVPPQKIALYLTPEKYLNEGVKLILGDAFEFCKKQESKIQPFTAPTPTPIKVTEDVCEIDFIFDLKPEIKISEYKNLKDETLIKTDDKPTEEEIEGAIERYRNKFAMEKIKEDPNAKIENGNIVLFDFEGSIDGIPFNGGKGNDFKLEIGSNKMIKGFEDQMINKTRGTSNINVTFPDDYTPDLAGKNAVFALNIKEIKEKILPNKDDELAKDLNIKNVTTYTQLKEYIVDQLTEQKLIQNKNIFVNKLIDIIRKKSIIEIPKAAIQKEVENLYKEFESRVLSQKMTLKEYKAQTKMTDSDIREELFNDARLRLESYLITDYVRNEEKFEVNELEIDNKYKKIAEQFGIELEYIKNVVMPESQIKEEIIKEKIIDFLYENNG